MASKSTSSAGISSEFARIDMLASILASSPVRGVQVGIGDDAAVLRVGREQLVWTVDNQVENVHFRRSFLSLRDIGWRSFNAAVSDVAAMGATAWCALSAIECPRTLVDRDLYEIVEGQASAASELRCTVVGGNLSRAAKLSIATTVLGRCKTPLLRGGAKAGNEIWLVGSVGLAAAGLALLQRKGNRRRAPALEQCIDAFRQPRALLDEGRKLNGRATSMIDVSDGLAGDAMHLAQRSGVAFEIDLKQLELVLPESLEAAAKVLSRSPLEFALYGGEDYALLATGPSQLRPRFAQAIGRVRKGTGVWLIDGKKKFLASRAAFDHFVRD